MPALKVGKLAVNREVSEGAKRKGYGSFLLEMARAFAFNMNEMGIACRFITVDADIEYNPDTPKFYFKNGFVVNLSQRSRNAKHTISMRKDIFADVFFGMDAIYNQTGFSFIKLAAEKPDLCPRY